MPAVSVLMPAYDAEPYIAEAIVSILGQTFRDFEFIIIDDGSTDRTLEIIKAFAARDPRIRVVSRGNRGLTTTLNEGLDLCQAPLLARMDADDISYPHRLQRQVAFLSENPGHVLLGARIMLIDPVGRELVRMPHPLDHATMDSWNMSLRTAPAHPVATFRTEALRKLGGYRHEYPSAEDTDLFLRLAEIGTIETLPDVLLSYRLHFSSIGLSRRREQMLFQWRAARDAAIRREIPFDIPEPQAMPIPGRAAVYQGWGWWALQGDNLATARYYAWRSLFTAPLVRGSWILAGCALRGR